MERQIGEVFDFKGTKLEVNIAMNKSDQYSKDLKSRKKNWESIKQTASAIAQQHLLLINNCFI